MKHIFLICLLVVSAVAQSPEPASPASVDAAGIKALISQLADPRVRMRDEAQAALGQLPEAVAALQEAAASHPSLEAQLRATKLLKVLRESIWTLESEALVTNKSDGPTVLRAVVASPDGSHLVGMHRGGAELLKTEGATPVAVLGSPCRSNTGLSGVQRAVAFSRDGRWVASADHTGSVFIDDLEKKRIHTLPAEVSKRLVRVSTRSATDPSTFTIVEREVEVGIEAWGIYFLPGDKGLLLYSSAGLRRYVLGGAADPLVSLRALFPKKGSTVSPCCSASSPDGAWLALGGEVSDGTGEVILVQTSDLSVKDRWQLAAIPASLAVPDGAEEILLGLRGVGIHRATRGGGTSQLLHPTNGWITGVKYAPDGRSAFFSSTVKETPLRQIALPSGETIWTAPPAEHGYEDVVMAGPDRLAVSLNNSLIQVWKGRSVAPLSNSTIR